MSDQLTSVDGMSPREIAKATAEGRLDALLKGDTPALELAEAKAEWQAAKAEAEPPPPAGIDQGARGGPRSPKYDDAWLATASAQEIAKATRAGKLVDLL